MAKIHNPRSKPMKKLVPHEGEPYQGPFLCDATPVRKLLLDLPPGAMRGLRRERPNFKKLYDEVTAAYPAHGRDAGISDANYQTIVETTQKISMLAPIVTVVLKLAEVCEESLITLEDQREHAISMVAAAIKNSAKFNRNPALAAPFEETIKYNNQAAVKAVVTRQENIRKKAAAPAK